jgi:hypothetical protein
MDIFFLKQHHPSSNLILLATIENNKTNQQKEKQNGTCDEKDHYKRQFSNDTNNDHWAT